MDASEVNNRLKDRLEDVVAYLYPAATIKGNVAHVGGIDGEKGNSMTIHVKGSKVGMFSDFANPEDKGGTPLYLWHRARGVSYATAVIEAKEWLGIKDDDHGFSKTKPTKVYLAPDKSGVMLAQPNSPAMDYITITRRIDPLVVANNKISDKDGGQVICFPYIDTESKKAVHLKFLAVERGLDGKKKMWASPETKRILFGMQTILDSAGHLVICEGEIDKLSWESLGQPCVSVPMGVNDMEWIDLCWTWLERFERIYLSFDMDGPGNEATRRVAKRLGLHRCHIVKLPHKDANECLCSGWKCADAKKALDDAKPFEIQEIQTPLQYADDVWNMFQRTEEGYTTPWYPQVPLRIRPGELTLVSGYDNSGKSVGLNHLLVDLRNQGARALVFSFEITPQRTLQWMTRQASATSHPHTKDDLVKTLTWLTEGIWLYDYVGTADVGKMFDAMLYASRRFGVDIIVIDSLFKCGISSEDYNAQKEFISKLTDFCKLGGVHIFLVAHARKPPSNQGGRNDDRIPTRDEISGTSDIKNGGFNVLMFWRNISKHLRLQELRRSQTPDLKTIVELEAKWDGRIRLDKQRFGDGQLGEIPTWFDGPSNQLKTAQCDRAKIYVP